MSSETFSDLSWAELAERACRERDKFEVENQRLVALNVHLEAKARRLHEALEPFAAEFVGDNMLCHKGVCPTEQCCRCGPILRARAALTEGLTR